MFGYFKMNLFLLRKSWIYITYGVLNSLLFPLIILGVYLDASINASTAGLDYDYV